MDFDIMWTTLAALLPDGFNLDFDEDEATISDGEKEMNIVYHDNCYVINGKSFHFEDTDPEIVNTLLIPCILQEFDNEKRF